MKPLFPIKVSLAATLLLLTGCTNLAEQEFQPLLLDNANLLAPATRSWIESYRFPRGYALAVRTVDLLQDATLGAEADDLFSQTAEASDHEKALEKRGVFVLVSRKPALIQVRVGSELYGAARWGGVIAGPEYIEKQRIAQTSGPEAALREIVPWLANSLPQAMDLPAYKRAVLQQAPQILADELEDLGLPSETFYGHYLLRPILRLRVLELNLFQSWWITYVVVAIIILLLQWLLGRALGAQGLGGMVRRKSQSKWAGQVIGGVQIFLGIVISIVLSIPPAASTVFLAGSRLEDQGALRASGIPGVERLTFDPEAYRVKTGLFLALLILSLRLVKGFGSRVSFLAPALLPSEEQERIFSQIEDEEPLRAFLIASFGSRMGKDISLTDEEFRKQPFTNAYLMPGIDDLKAAVMWSALAWLFLPQPVSMAAIYFWALPAIWGIFATLKTLWAYQQSKGRSVVLPAAAAVLLLAIATALVLKKGIPFPGLHLRGSQAASSFSTESKTSLRGVGPIRIGMTLEQAREVLGELHSDLEATADPKACYYVVPVHGPEGISIMVSQDRIARIDIVSTAFSTISGARVGDPEKRVLSLYRSRLKVASHQYDENGHYLIFTPKDQSDKNYRLIFETDGKVVTSFRVGRVPEIEWVEGCL